MDMPTDVRVPVFLTSGQTYRIAIGSTVILPCKINDPGSFVLVWKRGIAVLTAGAVKVTPDTRVSLLQWTPNGGAPDIPGLSNGGSYSLELKNVRPQDAGDYVCQVGSIEPKEITHTLEILVPPRIHHVSHLAPFEVLQGATVKMECRASGNPVPAIAWTRKNGALPSGERTVSGMSLVIQHADRHASGVYQCAADNGVGQPDIKQISLTVLFAPEIEAERGSVHSGIGIEAQLVCNVYAEPEANVIWYKDSTQLGTTERHASHTHGNRYSFIIRNVTSEDFGNYSCVANNVHGRARDHVTLTGIASTAQFESPAISDEKDTYNISWYVNSHAAVLEYRLFYRQVQAHRRKTHGESSPSFSTSVVYGTLKTSHDTLANGNNGNANGNNNGNNNGNARGTQIPSFKADWASVIIPGAGVRSPSMHIAPPYPAVTRQKMWYVIKALQPGTQYEARVQARNRYGWNKISQNYHFSTRSNDIENMVEPSAQPAVYGSNQNSLLNNAPAMNKDYLGMASLLFVAVALAF
ncbi:protein amalgam-like isoform X2 [Atheta coriaria]